MYRVRLAGSTVFVPGTDLPWVRGATLGTSSVLALVREHPSGTAGSASLSTLFQGKDACNLEPAASCLYHYGFTSSLVILLRAFDVPGCGRLAREAAGTGNKWVGIPREVRGGGIL